MWCCEPKKETWRQHEDNFEAKEPAATKKSADALRHRPHSSSVKLFSSQHSRSSHKQSDYLVKQVSPRKAAAAVGYDEDPMEIEINVEEIKFENNMRNY